jgi:CBS domain containing-hemolysin-like protein
MPESKFKSRARIIGLNFFFIAALYGLVSLNKEVLRPMSIHSDFAVTLTGCFPNFIAAYLISLAFVNAALSKKSNNSRLLAILSSTAIFIILTFEELRPLWGASTHYDPWDIAASGIGSLLAILTFELITMIRNK